MIFYICRYFFMTVEAQMLLGGLFEGFVTLFAFGFIFGMVAHHFARHDQRFQAGCGRCL